MAPRYHIHEIVSQLYLKVYCSQSPTSQSATNYFLNSSHQLYSPCNILCQIIPSLCGHKCMDFFLFSALRWVLLTASATLSFLWPNIINLQCWHTGIVLLLNVLITKRFHSKKSFISIRHQRFMPINSTLLLLGAILVLLFRKQSKELENGFC